ncbi:MAG TPA: hypothetical protein VL463_09660 [Kofleriaceae bacterium]|nr:hypothetical protein [Kofleriaceae bacterium]
MKRLAVLLLVAACGAPPHTIAFSDEWPTRVARFDDVSLAWTRVVKMRNGYEESLTLQATFKSPEWRAARIARDVRNAHMSDAAATDLVAKEQAALGDHYEVELLVTTWERRENDLDRGERSVWKVSLIDDDGTEVSPIEIVRDKRPREILLADFPEFGDFAVAYIAKFPKKTDLFRPGARKIGLHMWSARGGVELSWSRP